MNAPSKPPSWLELATKPQNAHSPPGSPRLPFSRPPSSLRRTSTLSIDSVSSTTSEYFAARLSGFDFKFDSHDGGHARSSREATPRAPRGPGAPLVDHTGERGFTEPRASATVSLCVEPSVDDAEPDPLWMLVWHLASPQAARVVRSPRGIPAAQARLRPEAPRGAALVYTAKTSEQVAGRAFLKLSHMHQHSLGTLAPARRDELIALALDADRDCEALDVSHEAWVRRLLDKACEQGILDADRVHEAVAYMEDQRFV